MIHKKIFLSFLFLFISLQLFSMQNLSIVERYALACQKNDLLELEKCIAENPNINIATIENECSKKGHNVSGLRMLCSPIHDPNDQEKVNKKLELAKILIARGALLNIKDNFTEKTPLHYACAQADNALITLLIQNGANTSLKDKNNKTAYDLLPSSQICQVREKLSNEKPNYCFALVYHLLMNKFENKKSYIQNLVPDVSNIIWNFYKELILNEVATEKWIWKPVCIEANIKNGIKNKTKQQCLTNILFCWSKAKKLEINKELTPVVVSNFIPKNNHNCFPFSGGTHSPFVDSFPYIEYY